MALVLLNKLDFLNEFPEDKIEQYFNLAHAHKTPHILGLPVPIFFLPLPFPFSRPLSSRFRLRFILFLAAVNVGC